METTFGFFDLVESFSKPGCAVCNLLLADVHRLLDSILYEYVTDPQIQAHFRASRGLCEAHGWQFVKLGNALGVAMLYDAALDDVLRVLTQSSPIGQDLPGLFQFLFPQNPNAALSSALEPTKPCIACQMQDESEVRYVRVLSEQLDDERLLNVYRTSDGLCLRHFSHTLRQTQHPERSKLLMAAQVEIWGRLKAQLEEFIRKSDFRYAGEAMGAEGTSWQRAVARLGGEQGVFGLRRNPR